MKNQTHIWMLVDSGEILLLKASPDQGEECLYSLYLEEYGVAVAEYIGTL